MLMTRGEDLGLKPCPLKSANIYLLEPHPATIDRQYRTSGLSSLLFQWIKMLLPYLVLTGSQITPRPVSLFTRILLLRWRANPYTYSPSLAMVLSNLESPTNLTLVLCGSDYWRSLATISRSTFVIRGVRGKVVLMKILTDCFDSITQKEQICRSTHKQS